MPEEAEARGGGQGGPRGSVAPLALAALLGLLAGDAARRPEEQRGSRVAIAAIDAYRTAVSPVLAASGLVRCRFTPTCSEYAREALRRFGSVRGALYAGGRLLRCHPWARGGHDPVPLRPAS